MKILNGKMMMARINFYSYVERRTTKGNCSATQRKNNYRDWWFIKNHSSGCYGIISLVNIRFPRGYVGKRVRLKVELVK